MIVDSTGVARRPAPERILEWLSGERVFISSPMGDTTAERQAVADTVREEGAEAIWFEELGRDADAEEAYLGGVDRATIYVGVLNELYGRQHPSGFSATETEYMRARERGKRVVVYSRLDAPAREGHTKRFLERIHVFVTAEEYQDIGDLVERVRRRLHQLAAEGLSPWVKLDEYVFRADEIADSGDAVTIKARVNNAEIVHALESLRDAWSRSRLRLTYGDRVGDGDVATVRRTVHAGGRDVLEIELRNVRSPTGDAMPVGTTGLSAEELAALGMRELFFGEALPSSLHMLESLADPGISREDLRQAFTQPNEVAEAIARLVVTEGLVGSGRAARITSFGLGPRVGDTRQIEIEWIDSRRFVNVEPERRRVEGAWQGA